MFNLTPKFFTSVHTIRLSKHSGFSHLFSFTTFSFHGFVVPLFLLLVTKYKTKHKTHKTLSYLPPWFFTIMGLCQSNNHSYDCSTQGVGGTFQDSTMMPPTLPGLRRNSTGGSFPSSSASVCSMSSTGGRSLAKAYPNDGSFPVQPACTEDDMSTEGILRDVVVSHHRSVKRKTRPSYSLGTKLHLLRCCFMKKVYPSSFTTAEQQRKTTYGCSYEWATLLGLPSLEEDEIPLMDYMDDFEEAY